MKVLLKTLPIILAILLFSCGSKTKTDISGRIDGAWDSKWEANIDGNKLTVKETVVFKSNGQSGNTGNFFQIFTGKLIDDDDENLPYKISVAGTWFIEDKNTIVMNYDLNTVSLETGKISKDTDYSDIGEALEKGDSDGLTSAATINFENDSKLSNYQMEKSDDILNFFKDNFRNFNKSKKAYTDVDVSSDILTAKSTEKEMGGEKTFDKYNKERYKKLFENKKPQKAPEPKIAERASTKSSVAMTGSGPYDWLSYRYADYNDVAYKSPDELRIMRNYIFARHGYKFKSQDLQEYFAGFSWYTPLYSDVYGSLNKIEKANIKFIQQYE